MGARKATLTSMKKILVPLMIVSVLATARAQVVVSMPFTLTATALVQNDDATNNGVTTTVFPPVKKSMTVATLLPLLAQGEFTAGNYPTNKFPTGAKLALAFYPTNFDHSYFKVTDSAGNLLVAISDIMQVQVSGNKLVASGKTVNATGLISGANDDALVTILYDDTGKPGGSMRFEFEGLLQAVGNDVVLSAAGHTYKESWTLKIISANGEGDYNGSDFVLYGSAMAAGSGNFVY